jgi:DNA-binding CsgD family transcriptional regulator
MTDAQVAELYSSGNSCAEVARLDKCSETCMYNRLISLGVVLRSRSEANKIFPDTIFMILYNMGLSTSQVGRVLGINSSTVTKRLHSLHYPLRSRTLAQKIRYTEKEFKKYFMVPQLLDRLVEWVN